MNVYRRLNTLLGKKEKVQFAGMLVLIFISALLETLGVSVIVPIISAVVTPDKILSNAMVQDAMLRAGLDPADNLAFVKVVLIAAIAVYLIKNLYLLFLYFVQVEHYIYYLSF